MQRDILLLTEMIEAAEQASPQLPDFAANLRLALNTLDQDI
jgi:hypothetical protein